MTAPTADLTADQVKALNRFDLASKALSGGKPGDNGVEVAYREAYKELVNVGLRQPLRQKYQG